MGARVLDANGKEVTPIMGSYGIGIERILTAAIEQSNDQERILAAGFDCAVHGGGDGDQRSATRRCARPAKSWPRSWKQQGLMCCWMTETSAPASNSKTRIWWGFPTASMWARRLPTGQVELVTRATASSVDVALSDVVEHVKKRVEEDALLLMV